MAPQRGVLGRFRRWLKRITTDEPPPGPPPAPPGEDEDFGDLERRVLRHIDSLHLERLPARRDRHGKLWPAEYNRNRVAERLQEATRLELEELLKMDRDEFRSWAKATGFFYH